MRLLEGMELQIRQSRQGKLVLAYVAMILMTGTLWVSNGQALGAVAGGVFFAMLLCLPAYLGVGSALASSVWTACVMLLVTHVAAYRANVALDTDWEPPTSETALNILGFAAALFASGVVAAVRYAMRTSKLTVEQIRSRQLREMTVEAKTLVQHDSKLRLIGFVVICGAVVSCFLATETQYISTPRLAATRFVFENIYEFEDKRGLAYTLASRTDARILSVTQTDATAEATLRVTTPAVPFELRKGEENSFAARRRWLSLPEADRKYVQTTLTLKMRRRGLTGWEVTNDEEEGDLVKIAAEGMKSGHIVPRNGIDRPRFNDFMALDAASRPTHPLILASLVLAVGLIGLGRRASQVISGIGMGLTPIAMFFLGALVVNRPL